MTTFRSKAQWAWAFATRKSWARKHAHATPSYKALPERKGRPAARTLMKGR